MRSGINRYIRFCDLFARPSFPPTAGAGQLRGPSFNPDKTFGQYLAHLQKATLLLGHPMDWLAPKSRGWISKGVKNAQDLAFKFPNFIRSNDL